MNFKKDRSIKEKVQDYFDNKIQNLHSNLMDKVLL
jgi:hypothetical protein